MRQFRTYGSVRGVSGNWHSYRDQARLFPDGGDSFRGDAPGLRLGRMQILNAQIKSPGPKAGDKPA